MEEAAHAATCWLCVDRDRDHAHHEHGACSSVGGPCRWRWRWRTAGRIATGGQAADASIATAGAATSDAAIATADARRPAKHAKQRAAARCPSGNYGGRRWRGRHGPASNAELSAAQRRLDAAAQRFAAVVAQRYDASAAVGPACGRHGSSRARLDPSRRWGRVFAWQRGPSWQRRPSKRGSHKARPAARAVWFGWQQRDSARWRVRQSSGPWPQHEARVSQAIIARWGRWRSRRWQSTHHAPRSHRWQPTW